MQNNPPNILSFSSEFPLRSFIITLNFYWFSCNCAWKNNQWILTLEHLPCPNLMEIFIYLFFNYKFIYFMRHQKYLLIIYVLISLEWINDLVKYWMFKSSYWNDCLNYLQNLILIFSQCSNFTHHQCLLLFLKKPLFKSW